MIVIHCNMFDANQFGLTIIGNETNDYNAYHSSEAVMQAIHESKEKDILLCGAPKEFLQGIKFTLENEELTQFGWNELNIEIKE